MRYVLTSRQMKSIDSYTIQKIGVPSLVLMERAALAVAQKARSMADQGAGFIAVCGSGNNGADAVAAARILKLWGYPARIVLTAPEGKGTGELQCQLKIARNLDMEFVDAKDLIRGDVHLSPKDLVIDGLFGVGLSRNVEGIYGDLADRINELRKKGLISGVVAVDIPSGISADTGQVMGRAVEADCTVTFGWEKRGTILYPGRQYAGEVATENIGFASGSLRNAMEEHLEEEERRLACTYGQEDLSKVPLRKAYSNKGTFGKVLIAAGSVDMCGAAYLSALAAYRMGAGLVKILTVEENRTVLQNLLPEAILASYRREQIMEERDEFSKMISSQCQWADVVAAGPGLGTEPYVEYLMEEILANACSPVILDADALNTIAAHPYLTSYFTDSVIITPHLGEMARLTGQTIPEIQRDLVQTAVQYASRYGLTCILKDAATVEVSCEGDIYINSSGSSAMAKAGSGDVLTGILAGLLALGLGEGEAARLGVYIHGLCGQLAAQKKGKHSILAADLADCLGEALGQLK